MRDENEQRGADTEQLVPTGVPGLDYILHGEVWSRRAARMAVRWRGSDADLSRSKANVKGEPGFSVFHPSEIDLGETAQLVMSAVAVARPHSSIFDGLAELRLLAGEALTYRRQLLAMKQYFEDLGPRC